MQDHNPFLTPRSADKGSEAGIEHPDRVENITWQTRMAPSTPAENALADALQAIFAEEIYDLPAVVERLRALVPAPGGAAQWSESLLRAELARLGS